MKAHDQLGLMALAALFLCILLKQSLIYPLMLVVMAAGLYLLDQLTP